MRDVVITGLGAFTPLGGTYDQTWAALLAGRSGVRLIDEDWAGDLSVQIAGCAAVDPNTIIDKVKARRLDRSAQLALIAAQEAWLGAGFGLGEANPVDPVRLGVCLGTGIGGLKSMVDNWDIYRDKGPRRVSPHAIPMLIANAPAANVGLLIGAKAGVHAAVSACASSNESIAQALDMIRLGRADVVLVGGTEACIHPLPVAAFAQMKALSRRNENPERASRPWDVDRDGFVMAEGSACMVVESLEHARARGARIYGTIAGAGITADSHDIVQPDPSGEGQRAAMVKALHDANLTPADVFHVNAHATSTPQGDVTEAQSIRHALGADVEHVVVTATKSMTGHLLGAAGALETMATVLALYHRQVPPTINLDNPEEGLELDIATTVRALPDGDLAAISNSFGFGGHNVAIAVTNANITV